MEDRPGIGSALYRLHFGSRSDVMQHLAPGLLAYKVEHRTVKHPIFFLTIFHSGFCTLLTFDSLVVSQIQREWFTLVSWRTRNYIYSPDFWISGCLLLRSYFFPFSFLAAAININSRIYLFFRRLFSLRSFSSFRHSSHFSYSRTQTGTHTHRVKIERCRRRWL